MRQGESFLARDLVRGGEPVRVNERTATRTLVAGDVIAARVVTVRGEVRLTSAVLAVDRDLAEEILALLDRTRRRAPGMMAGLVESIDPDLRARLESEMLDDDQMLHVAAPKITTLWLNAAIRRQLAPPPQLADTDGEPLTFVTLHYRLVPGASTAAVVDTLARIPDLRAEDDGLRWTLLAPARSATNGEDPASTDPGAEPTVQGTLNVEGDRLKVLVNSEGRARCVRDLLDPALAGLVGEPLVERVTPEQAMAQVAAQVEAQVEAHGGSTAPAVPEGLDSGELRATIHAVLDRHYRTTLDEPVPLLGDVSPRRAARSEDGRRAVANWLENLEQTSARLAADDPMRDYDFGWMWEELGVRDLRR